MTTIKNIYYEFKQLIDLPFSDKGAVWSIGESEHIPGFPVVCIGNTPINEFLGIVTSEDIYFNIFWYNVSDDGEVTAFDPEKFKRINKKGNDNFFDKFYNFKKWNQNIQN